MLGAGKGHTQPPAQQNTEGGMLGVSWSTCAAFRRLGVLSFCFFHVTCTDEPQDPPPLGEATIDMLQGNSVEAAFQKPRPVPTVYHICRV